MVKEFYENDCDINLILDRRLVDFRRRVPFPTQLYPGGQHRTSFGLWSNWPALFKLDASSVTGIVEETTAARSQAVDSVHDKSPVSEWCPNIRNFE